MELRALRYFIEVVRQQSFTAAADHLFVTQPTVSKMVRSLEEEIGTPLLLRDGRKFVLTDVGRVVFQRGQDVLSVYGGLESELADLGTLQKGELTVGIPSMGGTLFSPIIAAFRKRYPGIELKLHEQGARAIEAALAEGRLEVGGILQPSDPDMFDIWPIAHQPLWLVAPADSRWRGRESIQLAELSNEAFVMYGEGLALNDIVLAACRRAGFSPTIAGRSSHWDFIAAMAAAGVGVALLPASQCMRLDPRDVTLIREIQPEIPWDLALAWRRNGYLSHAARAWLVLARELLPLNKDAAVSPATLFSPFSTPAVDLKEPPER
jgi:DNA-binding transcriptional LysR family regulator